MNIKITHIQTDKEIKFYELIAVMLGHTGGEANAEVDESLEEGYSLDYLQDSYRFGIHWRLIYKGEHIAWIDKTVFKIDYIPEAPSKESLTTFLIKFEEWVAARALHKSCH